MRTRRLSRLTTPLTATRTGIPVRKSSTPSCPPGSGSAMGSCGGRASPPAPPPGWTWWTCRSSWTTNSSRGRPGRQASVRSGGNFTPSALMNSSGSQPSTVWREVGRIGINIFHGKYSGLLMLRVRDELKMTLIAYQTLYESSIAFGIRKALKAEQGEPQWSLVFHIWLLFPRQGGDGDLHPAAGGPEGEAREGGQRPGGSVSDGREESRGAEASRGEGAGRVLVIGVRPRGLLISYNFSLMPRRLITWRKPVNSSSPSWREFCTRNSDCVCGVKRCKQNKLISIDLATVMLSTSRAGYVLLMLPHLVVEPCWCCGLCHLPPPDETVSRSCWLVLTGSDSGQCLFKTSHNICREVWQQQAITPAQNHSNINQSPHTNSEKD